MVKARINQTGGVRANINSSTSSGPQQVSVQVPSTNVSISKQSGECEAPYSLGEDSASFNR